MAYQKETPQTAPGTIPAEEPHAGKGAGPLRVLRRNIMLAICLVSLAPLILINGILIYYYHVAYSEKVTAHLEELVIRQKQAIDEFLDKSVQVIGFIAEATPLDQLADDHSLSDILHKTQKSFANFIVDIGVIDQDGLQIAYAGPFHLLKAEYASSAWFKAARERQTYVSDVFSGIRGIPHFIVTALRKDKEQTRIVRATVDFALFKQLVSRLRVGRTGMAFIVNRQGELQTDRTVDSEIVTSVLNSIRTAKFDGQDHMDFEAPDPDGREFLYLAATLKNGDWILVFRQAKSDAFEHLYNARRLAVTILILGGLGIVTTGFLVTRRMVARVNLAEKDQEIMEKQIVESGKLAAIGELAAGIAHEINNPVAIMMEEAGWVEDLLHEKELDPVKDAPVVEDIRKALKGIAIQGRRCKEITQKLLSFARRTDSRVKKVQLNELIEEVTSLAIQKAQYANISIRLDLDQDLPEVCVSPTEMQQVMLNIINNAIDAKNKNEGIIVVTTRRDDQFVVIDVSDNGQGIPPANLERIFEPFYTTKPVGKGTGLGLSICYGLVKKMGGDITVESEVGVGTTFHVSVPLEIPCEDGPGNISRPRQ